MSKGARRCQSVRAAACCTCRARMPAPSRRRARLPADGIILDLEDCGRARRPRSRRASRSSAAVKAGGFGGREVFIRINGLDTPVAADDLTAAAQAAPDAILVPKISQSDQLEAVAERLLDMQRRSQNPHLGDDRDAARDLQRQRDIAAAAHGCRRRGSPASSWAPTISPRRRARASCRAARRCCSWLMTCVAAARAYGLDILDGVYNDISDAEGFAPNAPQARDMGFDGKTLIHPSQIEAVQRRLSRRARRRSRRRASIIAAFDQPENQGKGVMQIDGRMVERMHADMARRTVAIADAIAERGAWFRRRFAAGAMSRARATSRPGPIAPSACSRRRRSCSSSPSSGRCRRGR